MADAGPLPTLDPQAIGAQVRTDPEKMRAKLLPYAAPGAEARPEDRTIALRFITSSYELQGRYPEAAAYAQQWYDFADKRHEIRNMAQAMNEMGASNWPLGNLDSAVRQFKNSATLAAKIKDPNIWGEALFNLSVLMLNFGDYENALKYNLESQNVLQNDGGIPFPISGLGARANIYYRLGRYSDAKASLDQARIGLAKEDNIGAMALSGMGALVDEKLGDAADARRLATTCVQIQKTLKLALTETYLCELVLATLAINDGSTKIANEHLGRMKEALKETPESSGVSKIILQRDYHQSLAELAKREGRVSDFANESSIISELDRKLSSARESSRAAVAAAEIKTEGKDLSIALLEARNANLRLEARQRLIWIGGAIVSALAILAGLFLWYRARQMRIRQEQRHMERTRIARDLHDTLLQSMAGAQMQLQAVAMQAKSQESPIADRLGAMVQQLGLTMASARDAVWQMRSAAIERGDLVEAIDEWIGQTQRATSARITFDATAANGRFSSSDAEEIFRIVQEAVGNAVRHAEPTAIAIRLAKTAKRIELAVTDDGRGFELQSSSAGLGGRWGLVGMRERAERLEGSLAVDSTPGGGTRIVLTIPA